MDHKLLWVFLFVFIDVLGFSIILPLFPYYSERFSSSPSIIELILTSNALSQMLSTPIIGYLSDKYGRRPLLLICILGTFVSFVLLSMASSTTDLFISRVLDGLLGGNISLAQGNKSIYLLLICQAYIADVTDDSNRSKGLGLIGAGTTSLLCLTFQAFGFGFIVGPMVGGSLTHYGYQAPAIAASLVSLVNFIGVLLFLPESLPIEKRKSAHSFSNNESLTIVFRAFRIPKLVPLLILRFTYGFTFTLFETCFGFFNIQRFSMSARFSSYLLAYVGIVFSLVQGGGIRTLTRRFSEQSLIVIAHITLAISLVWWIGSFSIQTLLVALFPLSISLGLLHTLINSEITKQVKQSEMGETLGVSASIGSLTRVLAPTLSGFLIDNFGLTSPAILASILMIAFANPPRPNIATEYQTGVSWGEEDGTIYYSQILESVRIDTEFKDKSSTVLELYFDNTTWLIDNDKNICSNEGLIFGTQNNFDFVPISSFIGYDAINDCNAWSAITKDGNATVCVQNDDNTIPVWYLEPGLTPAFSFSDWEPGVPDQNLFNVPDNCI